MFQAELLFDMHWALKKGTENVQSILPLQRETAVHGVKPCKSSVDAHNFTMTAIALLSMMTTMC